MQRLKPQEEILEAFSLGEWKMMGAVTGTSLHSLSEALCSVFAVGLFGHNAQDRRAAEADVREITQMRDVQDTVNPSEFKPNDCGVYRNVWSAYTAAPRMSCMFCGINYV